MMVKLKVQIWRPDTHVGYVAEVEWEYDMTEGRDTGREHRGVSVLYPDGTLIHRNIHGPAVAHEHYQKLQVEHLVKNRVYNIIVDSLPSSMRKQILDSDGDPKLDESGQPRLIVKDKHRPTFKRLEGMHYEFTVPGLDEVTHQDLVNKLAKLGDNVVLVKSQS